MTLQDVHRRGTQFKCFFLLKICFFVSPFLNTYCWNYFQFSFINKANYYRHSTKRIKLIQQQKWRFVKILKTSQKILTSVYCKVYCIVSFSDLLRLNVDNWPKNFVLKNWLRRQKIDKAALKLKFHYKNKHLLISMYLPNLTKILLIKDLLGRQIPLS